jgi:hypothetical protein
MAYSIESRWKELLVYGEDGQEFVFDCGWGVKPPVAHVPSSAIWDQVTPPWMRGRRDEIVSRLEDQGSHRLVETEDGYDPFADADPRDGA